MRRIRLMQLLILVIYSLSGCSGNSIDDAVSKSIFIPLETTGAYYRTPLNSPITIELDVNRRADSVACIIQNYPHNGTIEQSLTEKWKITYTPNANYNGPDSFKFYATDGVDSSNVSEITLFIGDSLAAYDRSVSTQEDTAKDITLSVNNPGLANLIYNVNQPSHGSITQISGAIWQYTPEKDYTGTDSFTYYASAPGFEDSNIATVTVTIGDVNDPPEAFPSSAIVDEDSLINITLNALDVENDPLTYIVLTGPAHGTYTISGPVLTYIPNEDYYGTDSIEFIVSDGMSDSNIAAVSIDVSPTHDTPQARNQLLVVKNPQGSGGSLDFNFLIENPDTGPLTYNIGPVEHGSLSQISGTAWRFTAETSYLGKFAFTYTVTDVSGSTSNPSTVTVNVVPSYVIYVKADAPEGGNGTSWDTAYRYISDACSSAAEPGTEIWVAAGNYAKKSIFDSSVGTFDGTQSAIADISIYGGFNGTEFSRSGRNPSVNITTIDGSGSYHAIYANTVANLEIDGFIFKNASASSFGESALGGGIFIKNSSYINIKNCVFDSNSAGKGGAIYIANSSSLSIIDSTLSNNSASAGGGAVYLASVSTANISSSTTSFMSGNMSGEGGAVFIDQNSSSITIEKYNFSGNTSSTNGGALSNNGNSEIKFCSFSSNSAANFGGAISDSTGTSLIDTCTISGNSAGMGGGGLYTISLTGTTLTITNSVFDNNRNTASSLTDFSGGGIYNDRTNGLIINNSTIRNHASYIKHGGAIYSTGVLQITNTAITGNAAMENGGAIHSTGYCLVRDCNLDTSIANNSSAKYGGAIFNYTNSRCEIVNSHFNNNQAVNISDPMPPETAFPKTHGGAVCSYRHVSLTVSGSEFNGNSAISKGGSLGGAICDLEAMNNTNISNTVFYNNRSMLDAASSPAGWSPGDYSGGAIYIYNSITTASYMITGSHFKQNEATGPGTAIYADSPSTFTIDESLFEANAGIARTVQISEDPPEYIDVIYANGTFYNKNKAYLKNSVFGNNYAVLSGGAIYNDTDGNLSVINCLIMRNSSGTSGGGIYNAGASSIINSTIAENSSSAGAAIYDAGGLNVLNTIITGTIYTSGTPDIRYSRTDSLYAGEGNIILNPIFKTNTAVKLLNYTIGYYFLSQPTSISPCVGNGDPATSEDVLSILTGKTTYFSNIAPIIDIPDSAVVDMGYHYKPW